MQERPIGHEILRSRISRRQLFKTAGYTAFGIAAVTLIPQEILLSEERLGYHEEIDDETKLKLLQFNPITIAHRGGNSFDNLIKTKETNTDYAEADIRSKNSVIVVAHERYWGPFAYDRKRKFISIGNPHFVLDDMLELAKSNNQTVLLDFIGLPGNAIKKVASAISRNGQEDTTTFTGDWETLDKLTEYFDNSQMYYTIKTLPDLKNFQAQQSQREAQGVSLKKRTASMKNIDLIHTLGAKVIVYGISDSYSALEILQMGADGITTNNLSLINIWGSKNS